jgi:hypothetical protein
MRTRTLVVFSVEEDQVVSHLGVGDHVDPEFVGGGALLM